MCRLLPVLKDAVWSVGRIIVPSTVDTPPPRFVKERSEEKEENRPCLYSEGKTMR